MIRYEDEGPMRYMHVGNNETSVMGGMIRDCPWLPGTNFSVDMMAWMLFENLGELSQRNALQFGMGPGSITKYCHNFLKMRSTTVVELDPAMVVASRDWFLVPPNGERLNVIVGDAEVEIAKAERKGTVDALQVDMCTENFDGPAVDNIEFWTACKASLTANGCMTANLYSQVSSYNFWDSVERIQQVFSTESVWVLISTDPNSRVVIARNVPMPQDVTTLFENVNAIRSRFGLIGVDWLHRVQCPLPLK
jgi:spermidine synthase